MLPLIRILFDICLLKKGPEDIPYSQLILYMCFGLWIASLLATTILLQDFDSIDAWIGLASGVLGLFAYLVTLSVSGHGSRAVQLLSALTGAGALILFAMLAVLVLLSPFLGPKIANIAAILVMFWSIPVEGHIIARAIERHWYIGIVIAMMIFILQFVFTSTIASILVPSMAPDS